jgi:archaellum biogenesis ATPase FlaH
MNIASALLSSLINEQDLETWGNLQLHYLPKEYHSIYRAISKHFEHENSLPTFDDLILSIPSREVKEKITALKSLDIESEPYLLLEYLKNEYTQGEVLDEIDKYLDNSVAMSRAEENIEAIEEIVLSLRNKVELDTESVSMQKISILATEEDVQSYIPLGLNAEYDQGLRFTKNDLILLGGRRGAGKSFTCTNIAVSQYLNDASSLYFSIEMTKEQVFRRMVSTATGIPLKRIQERMISDIEYEILAKFQASRFEEGDETLNRYLETKDFEKFQEDITKLELRETQMDIVYEPSLTLAKIKSEIEHKISVSDVKVVIVDYLNQVKRSNVPGRNGQYDWTEQIEVSKALKQYAQDYNVLIFSPYQTDATGEARFAKGILDAADAAFALEAWTPQDACITFDCKKMRNGAMDSFTSEMDWDTLKIGPNSTLSPVQKAQLKEDMEDGDD